MQSMVRVCGSQIHKFNTCLCVPFFDMNMQNKLLWNCMGYVPLIVGGIVQYI
jgi:hypothetical protein